MAQQHPTNLEQLSAALARRERSFPGLRLSDLDGVDLDLNDCDLSGGCFKEARFGRANLRDARVEGCCFRQDLLWGGDLRGCALRNVQLCGANLDGAVLEGARVPCR